jgi:sugar transferase (PEP-CTERM system associated)
MFFIRYLIFQKFGAVLVEHLLLVVCAILNMSHLYAAPLSAAHLAGSLMRAFAVAVTFQGLLHLNDGYDFGTKFWARKFLAGFVKAILLACAVVLLLNLMIPGLFGASGDIAWMLISIPLVLALWHWLLRIHFDVSARRRKILIMGTGPLARQLAREILRHREYGLSICGFVDDDPSLLGVSIVNPKVIGLTKDLRLVASDEGVDNVAVEIQDRRGRLPVDDLLELKMRGVRVEEATSIYERITGKIAIENLKPSWIVFGDGFEVSRAIAVEKQIISFCGSLFLLLLSLPLFPLIALLIKLDSRGPVFHRQQRVGENGKIFTIFKFRSMRQDAERETGAVWAKVGDKRITRVGKYLRRLRLDELPQLINVFRGDMSLVGPRPERPEFVKELSNTIPFYYLRHSVKPGVTGWAQINFRYGSSVEDTIEKLQYDLFYIKNVSLALDLLIILNTIKTVLVRQGS